MGVQSNIHFISHSHFEDNEREHASRSHKNSHEALFLCQLYRYLRLQGYASSQITILSPYSDQIRLLRTIIPSFTQFLRTRFDALFLVLIIIPVAFS
jgi:superfamily I DNA and/or RNA helicase